MLQCKLQGCASYHYHRCRSLAIALDFAAEKAELVHYRTIIEGKAQNACLSYQVLASELHPASISHM